MKELASVLRDFYKEKHRVESASLSMDLNTIEEMARRKKRDGRQAPIYAFSKTIRWFAATRDVTARIAEAA
ncbi:MAG: hypothetical protein ACXWKP_06550 [Bradyrhizobium sp.]